MTGWPLLLPHDTIRRILNHNTRLLIHTRHLKPGEYQVQDEGLEQRNRQHRQEGRDDLQSDPNVVSIVITHVQRTTLLDIDLAMARAAGYRTQRDFYDAWLERRRVIIPGLEVLVHAFRLAETPRYLHERVHRGYTSDPARAARGEPEALDAMDLRRYADTARWRDDQIRREQAHRARLARWGRTLP